MLEQAFNWFLTTHAQVLRQGDKCGFEVLMLMSVAHMFGLYSPKELADYLDIRSQPLILPLHLMFASKQGRANTTKPELLLKMLTELKVLFAEEGIDITGFPLTLDSWFASEELRQKLLSLGFDNLIVAGKSSYVFTLKQQKSKARDCQDQLTLEQPQWGVNVPHLRTKAQSPTFGQVVLFFFAKSTTRVFYLMDFSRQPGRSAEIWHVWPQHHKIEQFWRLLKSVFRLKTIQLRGDGLYAGLLTHGYRLSDGVTFALSKSF